MKPRYEVAEIVRRFTDQLVKKYPQSAQVLKTLQAIGYCRTKYLGGHSSGCKHCGTVNYHYNSCRNRHCPKCQTTNRERWILQREAELLPVAYYHIVFTLPHELNSLATAHPKQVYDSLFTAAWQTIKVFAADPKYLGAKTGMTAILHTWGQQLWLHPHLHCIVPGGGITQHQQWKDANRNGKYLFPKRAMSKVYRAKYVSLLRKSGIDIPQPIAKKIFSKPWIVYAKRPFASPKTVVEYLGRYTHKIAISNHRLINISDQQIGFTYKDYRKGGKKKLAELKPFEFLRRFCLHILPKGFRRIRHYGILASRNKSKELNIARKHHGLEKWQRVEITWVEVAQQKLGFIPNQCPKCKKQMELLEVILPLRGPPIVQIKFN